MCTPEIAKVSVLIPRSGYETEFTKDVCRGATVLEAAQNEADAVSIAKMRKDEWLPYGAMLWDEDFTDDNLYASIGSKGVIGWEFEAYAEMRA